MTPHEALKAAVEERMRLAKEAGERGMNWTAGRNGDGTAVEHDGKHYAPVIYDDGYPTEAEAQHIAANDPAFVIRQCERDLKVLERHAPCVDCDPATVDWRHEPFCHRCAQDSPCVPIRDLAEVYQINLGVSDES